MNATPTLTKNDFIPEGDVKWCPGCGDYSILSSVQTIVPTLGIKKEDFVFISGIGCSSRFPYYMNTYGFHTIHGRAPTVASGVKMVNPNLSVWLVTGDGDGLSIGGNHTIHMIRRNMDIKVLLFNNRIYGLTKGQYSPTSEQGKVTKTSLMGSIDRPINPISLAIASGATFVARTAAANPKHMQQVLMEAAKHKGTAFVEIFQNCNIFNDGAFAKYLNKETKDIENLYLEPGKPLLFDLDRRGIALGGGSSPKLTISDNAGDNSKFLVHDPHQDDTTLAYLIGQLGIEDPSFPTAMGVIRQVSRPSYGNMLVAQEEEAKKSKGPGDLKKILYAGETWKVAEGDVANLDA